MEPQVTRRQARIVRGRIVDMRGYLHALKKRMAARGFASGHPLFDKVSNAVQAIGELYVDLDVITKDGPTALPEYKETAWLDQRSARKRNDRR